ncbi:MAG: hypothetical protein ACRCTX_26565 [Afipia sp.]
METKTVVATKPGYHGKLRLEGDEFQVPKEAKSSWFVDKKPADEKPARGRAKDAKPEGDAADGLA